jgi:hypothetical protein
MKSDPVESSGRGEGVTRTGRTCKKPKDLSVCESEEGGRGEGCVCMILSACESEECGRGKGGGVYGVERQNKLEIKLRSTSEEFAKAMDERTIQTQW